MDSIQEVTTPEQLELHRAQEAVAKAKAKLTEIQTARIAKAQADLIAERARKERELFEQREKQRQAEEHWRKKREEERLAREAEERAQQQKEQQLAAEADRLRREKDQREATEKKAKELAAEAHILEMEAKRQADELLRQTPAQEDRTTKHGSINVLSNENLAFEQLRTGKDAADHDTEGRQRLFARTATGSEIDYNVNPTTEESSAVGEYKTPAEYEISNGLLDPRVLALHFGEIHPFNWFLRPADGLLVANPYYWRVESMVPRNIYNGMPCVIVQVETGYELRSATPKVKIVLPVTPVELNSLLRLESIPTEIIDQNELITSDVTQEAQTDAK